MLNESINKEACENYLFEDYPLKACMEGLFSGSRVQEGVFGSKKAAPSLALASFFDNWILISFFVDFTCYVDCQPKEQLFCSSFINPKEPFPQPAIRGLLPQDSYPVIDSTDCRSLLNVTASVTR